MSDEVQLKKVFIECQSNCCKPLYVFEIVERQLRRWPTIDVQMKLNKKVSSESFEVILPDGQVVFSGIAERRFPTPVECVVKILDGLKIPYTDDDLKQSRERPTAGCCM